MTRLTWQACVLLLAGLACGGVRAGPVLDGVRAHDRLRCGVSEGIAGFSAQDADGHWSGLDVDFCRAVAAAVFGDAAKVTFVPLKASARFPALRAGAVDLLLRNTTWTLTREAVLRVHFPGVLFYDGQGFMVAAADPAAAVADLAGATVCVERGTRHESNMTGHFRALGLEVTALVLDSAAGAAAAFFDGRCRAYTSDASQLAAMRVGAPGGAQAYTILHERISKEPLGPAVSADDAEWALLVRWVLFSLIEAEERGYTGADIARRLGQERVIGLRSMSATDAALVENALGTVPGGLIKAVEAVGNYGEMFERNLGSDSALGLERGLNRLWQQGGLMYAPPIH